MMSRRRLSDFRKARLFPGVIATAVAACALLAGCDLQPRGTTVFKIEGKQLFERATLAPPSGAEGRAPLKLSWVDDNTFSTKLVLEPGRYLFSARSSAGMYYGREITVAAATKRYVLPPGNTGATTVAEGPTIKAEVTAEGSRPTDLVVLFIGSDFTVRRVSVKENRFSANAPAAGTYRVEVHALGDPARSYVREGLKIDGPVDLGLISLR